MGARARGAGGPGVTTARQADCGRQGGWRGEQGPGEPVDHCSSCRTAGCDGGPGQVLAAGQAPWAARGLAAVAADPESGRALPAVDAQLDGARQQAVRGWCAPLGAGGRRSGPVLAGRRVGGGGQILDEQRGGASAAWPDGQQRHPAFGRFGCGSPVPGGLARRARARRPARRMRLMAICSFFSRLGSVEWSRRGRVAWPARAGRRARGPGHRGPGPVPCARGPPG